MIDDAHSIADDILRNGYERWLRLEEAKAEVSDDIKELMAELKGHGFTPKAVRESFRRVRDLNDADKQEHDAIVDLYVASLTRARPAPAHEKTLNNFGSYAAAKGVETDDVGATASSTNSAHKPAGDLAADKGDKDRGSFPVGGPAHSNSPGIPLAEANSAGEAPSSSPASSARHSDDDIPAFIKQDKPGCLKLKDGHCRISFATSALCAECNQHRAISRASA